ncbi:MAG: low molecular weight protein arginine phosphatase [Lentisphaerae bacterium]|nr:low molecular weight protein arginine phosphatase [Lentisphaerota bacterium]
MSKPKLQILFVCTGNLCRSPVAEYLLRHALGPRTPWQVSSAGLFAGQGTPASPPAIEVLQERGINLRPHRSRQVTKEMVDAAALIVVMTSEHLAELKRRFPEAQDRIYLLKSFCSGGGDDRDVRDPLGGTAIVYRAICDDIEAALPGLILYLKSYSDERDAPKD